MKLFNIFSLYFAWSPNSYPWFNTLSDLTSAPTSSQISLPFSHYILDILAHRQFLEMAKSLPTSEPLLRSYLILESCPLIPTGLASSHLTSQVSTQMIPVTDYFIDHSELFLCTLLVSIIESCWLFQWHNSLLLILFICILVCWCWLSKMYTLWSQRSYLFCCPLYL